MAKYSFIEIKLGKIIGVDPKMSIIDIETKKISIDHFKMPNGELLKKIWEPTMIGTCYIFENELCASVVFEWEDCDWRFTFDRLRENCKILYYDATREFDEMICKGRFTNARRAHLPIPGPWKHLSNKMFDWINVRYYSNVHIKRSKDIPSKEIASWDGCSDDSRTEIIIVHCLRDVIQTYGEMGLPLTCNANKFLTDNKFALNEI